MATIAINLSNPTGVFICVFAHRHTNRRMIVAGGIPLFFCSDANRQQQIRSVSQTEKEAIFPVFDCVLWRTLRPLIATVKTEKMSVRSYRLCIRNIGMDMCRGKMYFQTIYNQFHFQLG